MAKYRHRIFEMYEFRDEALLALKPRSAPAMAEDAAAESWAAKHLAVSLAAGVTHVQFKEMRNFGERTLCELQEDFAQLADRLDRNSRLLLDFTGVESFSKESIDALALFNQKLRTKGSRIVLCCLEPATREAFFAATAN